MNNHSHTLEIIAENQAMVLERLLQVTRYRGFLVTEFNVLPCADNRQLDIKLTVQEPNKKETSKDNGVQRLYNQLNKLFDINHINLKQASTLQCQA